MTSTRRTGNGEELRDFLRAPASYPHAPDEVELRQTHISYLALSETYVYKVKKALDLGFLDFTELDARRHFYEEELRLNRRLCPDVYEAVVPITREEDGLAFGGEGPVVEYAIRMRRLSDEGFLTERLGDGSEARAALDRVAETLADFYEAHPATPEAARWGRVEALRRNSEENFQQTRGHIGALVTQPVFQALHFYTNSFYDAHYALFERRRATGRVLDGHGDLRLEHIHLTPERVCIYDCIEFSDRIRCVDVANEAAFLAMDLTYEGYPELAKYWIERIAEVLGDPALPRLTPFYACYRAHVRAKVRGMRTAEADASNDEAHEAAETARRHYQLALQYALAGTSPIAVVLMGPAGCGKTTQAEALAGATAWPHLSSDVLRKQQAGLPLGERPDAKAREKLYRPERTQAVYRALIEQARDHIESYQSVIIDATYSRREERDALRRELAEAGAPVFFVELAAEEDLLRERLEAREEEGTTSDARLEDFEMLARRYTPPDALEDARHVRVDAGGDQEATMLAMLKKLMGLHALPA